MTNSSVKISQLPDATRLSDEGVFPLFSDVVGDNTVKVSIEQLRKSLNFENAYATLAEGIADSDINTSFYLYTDTSKNYVNRYFNTDSGAHVVLDGQGNPVLYGTYALARNPVAPLLDQTGLTKIGACPNVTVLRTLVGSAGQNIFLAGYASANGVGGGILTGVADTNRTDDGVSFFRVNTGFGWARDISRGVSFADGGAVGDATFTEAVLDVNEAVITPAVITGTDDSVAVARVFNSRLAIRENVGKKYRLSSAISLVDGKVNFIGAGAEQTFFILDHFSPGLIFGAETFTTKSSGTFKDATILRPNYKNYTGTIGPKSLEFCNMEPLVVSGVREKNAIGYGIQATFCNNVTFTGNYVGNHLGTLLNPLTGTDGFHFYKCNDVWATGNEVENVGDDGISSGSFDINYPCVNINFTLNKLTRVFGTIKLYGFVNGAIIDKNEFRTGHEGGVYLTNDNNAPMGSYIKNVRITRNAFYSILGADSNVVAGGILMRYWPDNGTANATALIDQIYISDNLFDGCTSGVAAVTQDTYKRFSNIFIDHNTFRNAPLTSPGDRPYIRIHQCDYEFECTDNYFNNASGSAISINLSYGSYTATSREENYKITGNIIKGYSLSPTIGSMQRGIFVGPSKLTLLLTMTGNQVYGQQVSDTLAAQQAIYTGLVNPNSFIEANQADQNIAISNSTGAYKGVNKTLVNAPSSGTHYVGSILTSVSTGVQYFCSTQGTFGTLSSVNATTTAASKTITVTDASNLYAGAIIAITGVTGNKKILSINNLTVVLDSVCDNAVSAAAVNFVAPVFKTVALVTATS